LMAHLGVGGQYRIEAGHARAKLIVEKNWDYHQRVMCCLGNPCKYVHTCNLNWTIHICCASGFLMNAAILQGK
jgi:hypothetical protein